MTNFSGKNLNAACGGPQGGGMDSRRNGVAEISPKYLAEVTSNAIPVGFKQTEVGVIPEDWQVTTVGKVVSITTGNKNTQDKVVDGLYPFFVRSQQVERINTYSFDGEGVLTAGDGVGTGKIFHHIDGKFDFHQRVYLMYNFGDELDGYYFYIYFSNNFYDRIMSMTAKSSVDSVRREMIADMLMVLPPKSEQTAIANALSDVDALIGEQEKLIAKKQAIKTATMQQLLTGRTRLPQFALREDGTPKGTKPSELGEIPEDWEIVCFDQLKDKKDNWAITGGPFGSNLKASDYTENGVRVIQLQNIGDGVFKNDDFVYTSYKKANELISCNIYPDEIILSKMGDPVARACLIPHFHSRYVMCSDGIRLKVDSQRYSEKFVFYFLNYPLFRNQALDASTGSTRKRIGLSELRDLLLFAPPKEEQTAIATILSDMDEEIQALEQRLGKTRQIKQGMMQELLTGKTRLIKGEAHG